jgi:hypothetical protein
MVTVTAVGQSTAGTAAGSVHGFAAALTSFVGRAAAAGAVAGLLDQYRLVTVTGPGGVGKTRLVGQVAEQVAGRFADGVWLAELAPLRDPAQVPGAVAAALGIRDQLDVTRDPNPHVAFGYGPHYCLGAHLARMELQVALGAILSRLPVLRIAVPENELTWYARIMMRGLAAFPVAW